MTTETKPKPIPTLTVRASLVRVASTCRSGVDIRYYLKGILIEPRKEGGAYIVAANGHTMIACIDPTAKVSETVLINPSKATIAACPKAGTMPSLDDDNGHTLSLIEFDSKPALVLRDKDGVALHTQLGETTIDGVDKFPNWRRVLPDFSKLKRGYRSEMKPDYLVAPFAAFSNRTNYGPCVDAWQVPSESEDCENVVVQRLNARNDIIHLVMPRRLTNDGRDWLLNFAEAKKVTEQPKPAEEATPS